MKNSWENVIKNQLYLVRCDALATVSLKNVLFYFSHFVSKHIDSDVNYRELNS